MHVHHRKRLQRRFLFKQPPGPSAEVDMVPVYAVWMSHGPLARGTEQPALELIVAEGLVTQATWARATELRELSLNVRVRMKVGSEPNSRVYRVTAIAIEGVAQIGALKPALDQACAAIAKAKRGTQKH